MITHSRPSSHRSHRWITLMLIVAIVGFAGLVFADSGNPVKPVTGSGEKHLEVSAEGAQPAGDNSGSPNAATPLAVTVPLPGDTCASALTLTLNDTPVKGFTSGNFGVYCSLDNSRACSVDADCSASYSQPDAGACVKYDFAHNDYQTPETTTCYSGINNLPTTAPGRDIVYKFTAPADGKYSFEAIMFHPNDPIAAQNTVLYLTDDCTNSGVVNCIRGVNHTTRNPFLAGSSNGFSNNHSEVIDCHPMTSGQTVFIVFDDFAPGSCSNNAHACQHDADCAPGATCNPVLQAGSRVSMEVRPCNPEIEPNDTPATATPYNACGMIGEAPVAPAAHCYLGTRAGALCTRTTFLDQSVYDSNMRCSISGAQCVVDTTLGTSNCALPGELCQQQKDKDCDPRCDVGPNAGKSCTTQAFCNPVSDQGATCAGTCQIESTCVDNATGLDTGVACTPVCVGSSIPSVNGRFCCAGAACTQFSATGTGQCPGGGTCVVTPTVATAGMACSVGQTCSRIYNEGDVDFYSLGVVPNGSAIFAGVDGKASSDGDWRMRITTATQTLQFDDDDNVSRGNASSSVIAGALGNGQPTFLQVSRTQPRTSATYELYAHVRPPLAQAQLEDEIDPIGNDHYYLWPGDLWHISAIDNGANNGYVRGTFAYNQDSDCFKFLANKGDLMDWFGAANPQRTPGAIALVDIPQPIVFDAEPAGISNFGFGANPRKNTTPNVPQPGLKGLSPAVTSQYLQWRASYTGMYEVCFFALSQFLGQGTPNYPNNWSGSLTANCGPVQAAGSGTTTTDVSVVKTGPAGPVTSGDIIDYTITVTNNGNEIAQEIYLDETLDANLTFISLTVDDGFGGNNVACFSLPTPGTNDYPISCLNGFMAPGTTTTYTVTVQVNNCLTADTVIDNYVVLTQVSTDPNPNNDYSIYSLTAVPAAGNSCRDIVCSSSGCIYDLCTANDTCQAGVCVPGNPPNCDDNNVCTDDFCDAFSGCVNDSSTFVCLDDFNDCTANACDPIQGCIYPNEPPYTPCYDGNPCTFEDYCDGNGACGGVSVCDDGNACTDDFTQANTCVCTHANSASGSPCSDNNACTGTAAVPDACDGGGACVGGQTVTCDDGDACTNDSCDSSLGCVYTPVVCAPADQCHAAGVCAAGVCGYAPLPDGTTCDDGDSATTNDVCTAGVCAGASACDTQPTPKSEGYWKKLCKDGHGRPYHGDALTDADAACVGQLTDTFAGISTVDEICHEWDHDSDGTHHDTNGPLGKECEEKAERELMALALNICRGYVCLSQEVDSGCSGHDSHGNHTLTTVGDSLDTVDDILSDPNRNKDVCKNAKCLAKEINNGKGIHHTTLVLTKENVSGTKVRLTWQNPVMDDGSGEASSYTIWRRPLNINGVFVKLAQTTNMTWVDQTAGTGAYEYEVTFTIEP